MTTEVATVNYGELIAAKNIAQLQERTASLSDHDIWVAAEQSGTLGEGLRILRADRVREYAKDGESQTKIAKRFGVSRQRMGQVMDREHIVTEGMKADAKAKRAAVTNGGKAVAPSIPTAAEVDEANDSGVPFEGSSTLVTSQPAKGRVVVDVLNYLSAAHSETEKLVLLLAKHEPTNADRAGAEITKIRKNLDKIEKALA